MVMRYRSLGALRKHGLALLLAGTTAACAAIGPSAQLATPTPAFSPFIFFAGRTVGDGVLRTTLSPSRHIHVVGDGRVDGPALVLTQQVQEDGTPLRTRVWHLQAVDSSHFTGTLSDARGPVAAEVVGNCLHIRFDGKDGLGFEQWLYLQADGRGALSRMVVRKLGVPVASLRETIRRTS